MKEELALKDDSVTYGATVRAAHEVLQGKRRGLGRVLPFLGPAFIASVAYIDPGNFATNIASGSRYGYLLLWVVLLSNLMAILIQMMSAKLGIATGMNLPEVARERFPRWVSVGLWIQGELVVMATDLAEFIGAALGIHLLFGLPMVTSAIVAAILSFAILELQRRGFRSLEIGIAMMVGVVVLSFAVQVFFAHPSLTGVVEGLLTPRFQDVDSVMLAAGILGATVMPHAIYLHSALTQRRVVGKNEEEKRRIFHYERIDVLIAMLIAGAVNASMLIVSAALFHGNRIAVEDIDVAFQQFGHLISPFAAILFGIALLSSGLSSSSVGTLAGDIIMQGFIRWRIPLLLRRFITMVPPLMLIILGINPTLALVISQVILSFGIAFALVPLILFTGDRTLMGGLVNRASTNIVAWIVAALIIALNLFLLCQTLLRMFGLT